ncbi:MAG: DUF1841 family protein [Gammaproteobacteria bacterium]|nr:DUF1841 family protein [Gammaproteobacteria bacterium]
MFAEQNRAQLRQGWREAWRRHRCGLPLEPLQAQIVEVIAQHPEYHALLEDAAAPPPQSDGMENPYLHLSLHLGLREQLGTNRPAGITGVFARLQRRSGSLHAAEHRMMEVLASVLWDAQRAGRAPDESDYLERLQRL